MLVKLGAIIVKLINYLHVGFVVCLNEAMDMILGTETMVTLFRVSRLLRGG